MIDFSLHIFPEIATKYCADFQISISIGKSQLVKKSTRDKVTGRRKKLHTATLCDFHSSSDTV
jgi:hypothetical protein